MPDTAHATTGADREALAILAEAKRRFCLDYAHLADVPCEQCALARVAQGEPSPCLLRRRECSAIQSQLNRMAADTSEGHRNWRAEYQNDPPPPETRTLVMLDAGTIIEARSGLAQYRVPDDAEVLVQGRDVGRNWIHTVTMAISAGKVCRVIDYYATPVDSPGGRVLQDTLEGRDKQHQIEAAVYMALRSLAHADAALGTYTRLDGSPVPMNLTTYDSRYAMHVVRQHCDEAGPAHVAVMGMGTVKGSTHHWNLPRDVERARRVGGSPKDRSYLCYDGNCYMKWALGNWRYYAHSDWYKAHVHGGYLLSPGEPGSISLCDPVGVDGAVIEGALRTKAHSTYAQHVTAEVEEQTSPGETRWAKVKGREANHYLDATYLCLVAAAILEWFVSPAIRLPDSSPAPQAQPRAARVEQVARVGAPAPAERERRSRGAVSAPPRRQFRRTY